MSDERLRCAESALRSVPEQYRTVDAAEVAGRDRGRSVYHGMYVAWAWGQDGRGRWYLDFLSEHPHPGMAADRYFADGTTEPIATPGGARVISRDPVEDAELERAFIERNEAAYAALRRRGLLPPEGGNGGSQAITEYLLTGGPRSPGRDSSVRLGGGWDDLLDREMEQGYWTGLQDFVARERASHDVYPPADQTFAAFELTPFDEVKVVVLGQDPYSGPGQAHGLAFSVPAGVAIPPSLRNIRKELVEDLGISESDLPQHGDLTGWARQGVLLLNTTLTVRSGTPGSHQGRGWERFTDAVIRSISADLVGVVFILWGGQARKKAKHIDRSRHPAPIESAHPAAWANAHVPFAESRPFTTANQRLEAAGRSPVDWTRLDRNPRDG